MDVVKRAVEKLQERFGGEIISVEEGAAKQTLVNVKPARIVEMLRLLKEDGELGFDGLTDLCGVDYLNQDMTERFCVVYNLYSFKHNERLWLKAFVPEEKPEIDSMASLWRAADWAEREAYDMYGIIFRNHPHLKRLLLPDDYQYFPLRKDYPLTGVGERMNFPKYPVES